MNTTLKARLRDELAVEYHGGIEAVLIIVSDWLQDEERDYREDDRHVSAEAIRDLWLNRMR